ncbi:DUF3450 domain-containing protein [Algicola sagamiensis]|uniref:DUF3450 domain-containing protein n=1 Tax=Algicola sagamiensis TaxID=163869 RepID=UPI00037B7C31|nr:DUF3450 domain-containing protein [Algicola sagamiensis]
MSIKKSLLSTALVSALAVAGPLQAADKLDALHKAERDIHKAAQKSQNKIDGIYEQTQELLFEYRQVVDETENLKVYNDHVATMVKGQNDELASLQKQIDQVDETKKNVVPLMYRMIDTLEAFINADIPMLASERKARVEKLRTTMGRADVATSEKYRLVLEAYQIEKDYGSAVRAYESELDVDGTMIQVDFVHVGRIALLAQSKDKKRAWVWNNKERKWNQLGDEYLRSVSETIDIAQKAATPNLIKLPIFAAE